MSIYTMKNIKYTQYTYNWYIIYTKQNYAVLNMSGILLYVIKKRKKSYKYFIYESMYFYEWVFCTIW